MFGKPVWSSEKKLQTLEDKGARFLRNVGNVLFNHAACHRRNGNLFLTLI
jgi:hypothetical protein